MAGNRTLNKAKANQNDEFYTRIGDIELELKHYKEHFKNKIIYCNCDDPEWSNFWKYFSLNFEQLQLKKLISTHYDRIESTYKLEFDGTNTIKTDLTQNGDFRSPECIDLLQEADIVVTNPPFSLFREYMEQLITYEKKFLIIGNPNALHYKEIFPLVRENKIWVGYKSMSTDMLFDVSEEFAQWLVENKKKGSGYRIVDGVVKGRSQAIWFTNLDIQKRHEDLILYKTYNPEEYPKYENYNAININKVTDIPIDYYDEMGVPDSFLDSYNPSQFEIIGLGSGGLGQAIGVGGITPEHKKQMKGHSAAGDLYYLLPDGKPKVPFSRIIIRRVNS